MIHGDPKIEGFNTTFCHNIMRLYNNRNDNRFARVIVSFCLCGWNFFSRERSINLILKNWNDIVWAMSDENVTCNLTGDFCRDLD